METKLNKLCIYDVNWQILRVRLLARNNTWGGWDSPDMNIKVLNEYLGDYDNITKLYRVINLLGGVRRGFGQRGLLGTFADDKVRCYAADVSREYFVLKEQGEKLVDVTVEQVLEDLNLADVSDLKKVRFDLSERLNAHKNSKFRGGLRWFLRLLNAYLLEVSNEVI
jgi:hypothetical protein